MIELQPPMALPLCIDGRRRVGKLDNTLIIYISGDNGTSAEGTLEGTPNQMTAYNGILDLPEIELMRYYEAWGSEKTYPHMSVAWSWAFDTPFKWTKQVASHFGGTRQGMAISWPGHITDLGGIRSQFHHIIDIVPTILEATGIQAPTTVNGIAQRPIEGVSMTYTFDKANANAPSKRDTQYHAAELRRLRRQLFAVDRHRGTRRTRCARDLLGRCVRCKRHAEKDVASHYGVPSTRLKLLIELRATASGAAEHSLNSKGRSR
jgi:arylsulfatase A-like enzyme